MKNCKIVLIAVIIFTSINTFAQYVQEKPARSLNCIKKGDVIIDGFYGFPYLTGVLVKKILADSLGLNGARNFNHFGARLEYMVWNKIGLGIEYTYALLTVKYQGNNGRYYTAGVSKQRFLGKFNYHFATTEKLDVYATAGIGYTNTKVFTNEPGMKSVSVSVIPVALRTGIGMRYFFTEAVGLNVEVGLGGPLMQAGLSLKF